jgi:argininosuccinate lyase
MTEPKQPASPANQTAWSGRFSEPVSDLVKRYTASVFFDHRMWRQDIRASLAHARMLARQKTSLAPRPRGDRAGHGDDSAEIEAGTFNWNLDDEDVHLNIEKRLTALVGDAGKRLHTGRSRNDQVATDIRLWLRDTIDEIDSLLRDLQQSLLDTAEIHVATPMPGFTHLQVAQPVTFGHHLLAYFEMLRRDRERFADCRRRVNRLPLGAAALAGTTFPIDREAVARELGFESVCENSLDAVSDRDFAIEFLCRRITGDDPCLALLGRTDPVDEPARRLHRPGRPLLHRLLDHAAEEKSGRAGTGARQDRPRLRPSDGAADLDEGPAAGLQQGQPGRQGTPVRHRGHADRHLAHLCRPGAGHPGQAEAMAAALRQGYATATDLADYLVKKGLPFRDAHEAVARAVRACEARGCDLPDLTLAELRSFSPLVE